MKTIFITISRGVSVRNILQTDLYQILKTSGHCLVILTPAWKDEKFTREFSAGNVFFENLIEPKWTALDQFFVGWHKALVYNKSTVMRDLYGIYDPRDRNVAKYIIKKIVFGPLSRLGFLKEFFRWLDKICVQDRYYEEIFEKYKPDVIFSTSVMDDADVFVLKQARARGVKIIAAVKSWDNISKMSFRVKADRILVWGDYSKEEAQKFQNYKESEIVICGVPQFDFYKNPDYLMEREKFCREFGIAPEKRIILFTSGGKVVKHDGEVAKIIADYIHDGKIKNAAILVRPHFAYAADEKKFDIVADSPNVFIDRQYERSEIFRDKWDYSKAQIKRFANMMRHADLVIATASTTSLDAAAYDKPIINIAFDGYAKVSFAESIAHGYINEHNSHVIKTGGIWIVDNKEELLNAINSLLVNPRLLQDGRENLRDYFCYKIDGQSARRMAEEVLKFLEE